MKKIEISSLETSLANYLNELNAKEVYSQQINSFYMES